MNKRLKYSAFASLLGLLVCVSVACSATAEAKNEADSNEMQEWVVVETESQTTACTPIVLSEEQYIKLVADFTSSDKKFKGKKPCIIDFYADWCRPCRMFAPTFENMAEKYGNKIDFYKVNTDNCKKLSAAYSINNIPTLFFFDKKGTLHRAVGAPSEEEFENAIKQIMQ